MRGWRAYDESGFRRGAEGCLGRNCVPYGYGDEAKLEYDAGHSAYNPNETTIGPTKLGEPGGRIEE